MTDVVNGSVTIAPSEGFDRTKFIISSPSDSLSSKILNITCFSVSFGAKVIVVSDEVSISSATSKPAPTSSGIISVSSLS